MADLKPDLSIFNHNSQQMGIGEMLGAARGVQEYQGRQSMTDALQQSIDRETGEVDFDKATGIWAAGPGFKRTEDATALMQGTQYQIQTRKMRQEGIAQVYSQLADNPNPTQEDYDRTKALAAKVFGAKSAAVVDKYLSGTSPAKNKAEFAKRLSQLGAAFKVFPDTETIQTTQGPVVVPKSQYAQEVRASQARGPVPAAPATDESGAVTPDHMTASDAAFGRGMLGQDEQAQKRWRDEQRESGNYRQDVQGLETVVREVSKPDTPTGPTADISSNFKRLLHSFGLIDDDKMKGTISYQEAKKYLQDYVNRQGFSSQSIEHLAAAVSATPNMTLEKTTILEMAKTALALRRMRQVGFEEFGRLRDPRTGRGAQPAAFDNWFANWAPRQDERAFAADMMSPEQQDRLDAEFKQSREADSRFARTHEAGERSRIYRSRGFWKQ